MRLPDVLRMKLFLHLFFSLLIIKHAQHRCHACFLTPAGNQRHGDPGAHPQCTGPYDGDPADLPHVAGQQQPLHEAQPQDLLAAVRPAGRIPAEPGGKVASRGRFACSSPGLREFDWKFEPLIC